ncbi:MAG: class I SAM-dependent methyltransferase [Myxococcales bacterium]|nr:class I SAM-dependent methyltransferase [Myxococcales bacterium]
MPTPSGIEAAKLGTPESRGKDEHARYVREEWNKFHREGIPLQRLAARVVASPRSVLDVGCGAGQELLPYLGARCVGIDLRRSGLVEGRELFGPRAPPFLIASAEALPFEAGAFDVVLCRLALPYMDVKCALSEMARVLARHGALVVQIHHLRYYLRRGLDGPLAVVHAARVIARGAAFELTGRQPQGEVFQLVGSTRRMLMAVGLAVVEVDEADRGAPIVLATRR